MNTTDQQRNGVTQKRTWVAPTAIPLSSRGPTVKFNREPAERSRSGISYAPS